MFSHYRKIDEEPPALNTDESILTKCLFFTSNRLSNILRKKAEELAALLAPLCPCEVTESPGEAGGGSMPGVILPGWAVALTPAEELERFLRGWETPVIGRIHKGKLLLDVRTLLPGDEAVIAAALARWKEGPP